MGTLNKLKLSNVTYNKLAALSSALYGFIFLTIVSNLYDIDSFNFFSYEKQLILFIVSFSDFISLPLLNKLDNRLSLTQIIFSKSIISLIVLFIVCDSDYFLFFTCSVINLLYNSIYIYFLQKNLYEKIFL